MEFKISAYDDDGLTDRTAEQPSDGDDGSNEDLHATRGPDAPVLNDDEGTQVEIPVEDAPKSTEAAPKVTVRCRAQIQTVRLDSRDFKPSWPIAIALLEQLSGWTVFALRLGTLALIQQCVRELAEPDAPKDLVVKLRVLTDALALMPLEA